MVAGGLEGKIPGATVIDRGATERFLILSEAVPGMFGVFGGGNAPEVERGLAIGFGVEDHLDEQDGGGVEAVIFGAIAGGGVGVVAGSGSIVDEGSGDWLRFNRGRRLGVGIIDDIKSGEAGFELVAEMSFGLGVEMIFLANFGEEGSENFNICWILGLTDRETFLLMAFPALAIRSLHGAQKFVLIRGEVEDPSIGRIKVVGLDEVKLAELLNREGDSRLDANKESMMLASKVGKSVEGELEIGDRRFLKSGAIRTIEVVAQRSVLKGSENFELRSLEAEGSLAFEVE